MQKVAESNQPHVILRCKHCIRYLYKRLKINDVVFTFCDLDSRIFGHIRHLVILCAVA